MAGGQAVKAGRAFVEIVLRNKVKQGLDQVAAQLRTFGKVTASIGAALSGASATVLAPLAAAVNQFSMVGDAVDKMAARTGLSTEAVSELAHAADLSGTSIESLETAVKKMQDTVVSAARGSEQASLALRRLGLSGQELAKLAPDQQLAAIAERIAAIQNPALRTATALDIFGKAGTQLLPLMADGAAGIRDMRAQARALGLSLDRDTVTSAAQLNDALGTVRSTLRGVVVQIGAALAPAVTDVANRLVELIGGVTRWVKENRGLVVMVATGALAVGALGAALSTLGVTLVGASLAVSGLSKLVVGVGIVAAKAGALLATLVSPLGLITAAVAAGVVVFFQWTGAGQRLAGELTRAFGSIVGIARQAFGGILDAVASDDLQLAARIAWLGIQAVWQTGVASLMKLWAIVTQAAQQAWSLVSQYAVQAGSFVAGLWAQLPTWITGPLTQVGQLIGQVATWISEQFQAMVAPVIDTVMAIGSAIAAGEWGLAAEIAWTSIKLAFASGVAWVANLWTEFSAGLASFFDGAVTTIRVAWNNVTSFIARQLVALVGGVQRALDALAQVDPTGLADKLKASLTLDVQGTLRAIEEDRQRFNADLQRGGQQRDLGRGAAVSEDLAANQRHLAELQQQRDAALVNLRGLAPRGKPADTSEELSAAMAELEAAVKLAADKRTGFAGDQQPSLAATQDLGGVLDESTKLASAGTFSAAAAAGLGIGGVNDKSLRAQLDSADYLRQLVQMGKRNRLVFG